MLEPHRRLTVAPGTSIGQPGEQQRHARDVAVVLAGLVGAAVDDVVDRAPSRRSALRAISALMRDRAEVVGAHRRERAAVAAERRAHRVADEGFLHDRLRFAVAATRRPCARRVDQRHAGQLLQFVERQARRRSRRTREPSRRDVDHREVGVDAVDAADAGQRIGAARRRSCSRPSWSGAPSSRRPAWRRSRGPSRRRPRESRRARRCASWRGRPSTETWNAPSTQKSRWPPRIIANESA